MEVASDSISEAFDGEPGVRLIQDAMGENWQALHASADYREVSIRPIGRRLEDILRQIETVFRPSPDGKEDSVDRLSDGLKSLFYLSMVAAAFDIEELLLAGSATYEADHGTVDEAISQEQLDPPSLTVFAVEEPENHLAPHYLGRIMAAFRAISQSPRAQVAITSHAPSVIRRIEPEEIRHLRLDPATGTATLRAIKLPDATDEAHKFVRQAVKAYPELYFSRFVVLGEGDSEEVVLPRLSDALGLPFDTSFVSVVPLGGRHVNHFWRLLNDLEIPFCTLLDLDRERGGGGWGRVKYACKQLLAIGVTKEAILTVDDGNGGTRVLSDEELAEMHTWDVTDTKQMSGWARKLEKHGVFFSIPLDLDFLMLKRFRGAYEATAADRRGPRIPVEDDDDKQEQDAAALAAVLKSPDSDATTYTNYDASLFYWYRYLFLGREKPTTHILALAGLSDEDIAAGCPAVLRRGIVKSCG